MGNHQGLMTTNLMLAFMTLLVKGGGFTATAVELHPIVHYIPAAAAAAAKETPVVVLDEQRRVLEPFQLCLDCRCCAVGAPSNCSTMPCCFGIVCNLPEKPFGVCAFVPKTCNCTSCGGGQ